MTAQEATRIIERRRQALAAKVLAGQILKSEREEENNDAKTTLHESN